jgi:hypothetical protein
MHGMMKPENAYAEGSRPMKDKIHKLTIAFRKLDIGTGFQAAIGFPEYLRPFCDTLNHKAEVDEIEVILGLVISFLFYAWP